MKCPFSSCEDTPSETFNKWNPECKRCKHYEECTHQEAKDKGYDDSPKDKRPTKSSRADSIPEHREVIKDFAGKPKITNEDVTDIVIDLHTMTTASILRECLIRNLYKEKIKGERE